jgi:GNAT superfamily N-acetyltransferase
MNRAAEGIVATPITMSLLDEAAGTDAGLVSRLTELINGVYEIAEAGLWRDAATRTTASEMAEFIRARQLAVASVRGQIAGAIRVHAVSDVMGEFGLLATAPEHRGIGIGSALVDFAEQHCRDRGLRAIQLELLVPRSWRHPSKEFLDAWYQRIGYRVTRTTSVEESEPQLAPLLATPCQFVVYEKPLGGPEGRTSRTVASSG